MNESIGSISSEIISDPDTFIEVLPLRFLQHQISALKYEITTDRRREAGEADEADRDHAATGGEDRGHPHPLRSASSGRVKVQTKSRVY